MTELRYQPYGHAVEVSPDVVRVTFTRKRTVAPQIIRARVELAGYFDILSTRMTTPRIVMQARDGAWTTWESRRLRDDEPDTPRQSPPLTR